MRSAPSTTARDEHGKRGERFFAKLDTNGDGAIDASESASKAQHIFARMDDNGDGVVTEDEIGRLRAQAPR